MLSSSKGKRRAIDYGDEGDSTKSMYRISGEGSASTNFYDQHSTSVQDRTVEQEHHQGSPIQDKGDSDGGGDSEEEADSDSEDELDFKSPPSSEEMLSRISARYPDHILMIDRITKILINQRNLQDHIKTALRALLDLRADLRGDASDIYKFFGESRPQPFPELDLEPDYERIDAYDSDTDTPLVLPGSWSLLRPLLNFSSILRLGFGDQALYIHILSSIFSNMQILFPSPRRPYFRRDIPTPLPCIRQGAVIKRNPNECRRDECRYWDCDD
ncbi:hypothetical protein BKA61DRAFT_701084 [Leptodontidium sp. MPI-SDFR-AT-0119]|nr:hypothetical protein BKA61DRAFT_701084 [Leptodontidium sp. MPI-SDFR-AT-0119]